MLGLRIRKARRDAGFTSAEGLARELGVSWRTVQRWETGRTKPDLDRLHEIAAALGVQASDLVRQAA